MGKRLQDAKLLALKMERWTTTKECRQPLEDKKGKETDFS